MRDERVDIERQDELRHIGRIVEANLIFAFEPVGLHAEKRHARELAGQMPDQCGKEVGDGRLLGELVDRLCRGVEQRPHSCHVVAECARVR